MANYQLAQLNIAKLQAPIESAQLADFVSNLDRINALADSSAGFVWRLADDTGNATDINHPFSSDYIVNLSVWESVDALQAFVYRSAHTDIMKRKKEWFHAPTETNMVLWWVKSGHRPNALEGYERLMQLRTLNSADTNPDPASELPVVFTFSRPQPAPAQ